MKKISAVILLFIFSIQFIYSAVVITWFFANRDYVAAELCINKEKPQMQCNGKCFLNKKLSEPENNQNNHSPKEIKKLIETSPYLISTTNEHAEVIQVGTITETRHVENYHFINCQDIFHPPGTTFS